MKRIVSIILCIMLISSVAIMIVACDTNKEEEPENISGSMTDSQLNDTTQDKVDKPVINENMTMQEKINAIYGNAKNEAKTITSVQDLAIMTSINYTVKGKGPIGVAPAILNGEEITLITLGGTEFVEGQATTIIESKLASEGKSNDYLKAVVKLFIDGVIPKDKPVMITGISLGGMIAQQVIGERRIQNDYDIKAVVTFGSPFTLPTTRRGVKVVRFTDTHDQVPVLGETMLPNVSGINMDKVNALQETERIMETSKYTDAIETHALSYIEDECWNKYDFMGDTNKSNELVLKSSLTYYDAPKLS